MQALIIAAGKGSRLNHRFSPKPLIPIFGVSLIERIILRSKIAGITDFKIVVGYKADKIKKKLGNGEKYGVKIEYITNREWKKGNGVSVLKAKDHIKENFLLLMSDHLFDESILKKLQQVKLEDNQCILCIDKDLGGEHFSLDDVTRVWVTEDRVKKIGKDVGKYNAIDTGIFLCSPVIFKALEESVSKGQYSLSAGNQILSNWGKLKTLDVTGSFWVDVDDDVALKKAKKILIQHLTKSTDGPISKRLNRRFSTKISSVLAHFNITPNQITLFCFFLSVLSAIFFYFGGYGYIWIIMAGAIAQLSSILDGCDGEIARLKFIHSKFGEWLDRVLDRYSDGLIILGMTHATWRATSNELVWLAGFGALIGTFMNSYTAIHYDELLKKKLLRRETAFRLGRDVRLFIVFIGALLNQLLPTLILLAVVTNFESLRRLLVLRDVYPLVQTD